MITAAGLLTAGTSKNDQTGSKTKRSSFLDLAARDTTIKPGDDFFGYANGTWMKHTEIPGDQPGWDSFSTLGEANQNNLKKTLDNISKSEHSVGSLEQKLADFYYSGMDTVAIEKAGDEPLMPMLAKVDAVTTYPELLKLLAEAAKETLDGGFINFGVDADAKNSKKMHCSLGKRA